MVNNQHLQCQIVTKREDPACNLSLLFKLCETPGIFLKSLNPYRLFHPSKERGFCIEPLGKPRRRFFFKCVTLKRKWLLLFCRTDRRQTAHAIADWTAKSKLTNPGGGSCYSKARHDWKCCLDFFSSYLLLPLLCNSPQGSSDITPDF